MAVSNLVEDSGAEDSSPVGASSPAWAVPLAVHLTILQVDLRLGVRDAEVCR